jgi:cell wall assembly regulator SMI1
VTTSSAKATSDYLAWVRLNAPRVFATLLSPSSPDVLESLSDRYGRPFPPELVDLYRCFGGQPPWAETLLPSDIDNGASFTVLTPDEAFSVWSDRVAFGRDVPAVNQMQFDASVGVRAVYFHRGWVPFASNGSTCLLCIDQAPADSGHEGQVVAYWDDVQERRVVARNLPELLAAALQASRDGRAVYEQDIGIALVRP